MRENGYLDGASMRQQQLLLDGLRIVLNVGNGAGYFFNGVLEDCGADVSHSIHLTLEYWPMMDETIWACRHWHYVGYGR